MKIRRRVRLDHRLHLQSVSRARNGRIKRKEAERRNARIIAKIQNTPEGLEYSPEVKSWLATHVGKPFSKITADDIKAAIES